MGSEMCIRDRAYMGRLSGMAKEDSIPRGHEVLDFVGIGEERYRPVGSYSTGMKQRVKLAQAIVHDPDILFLDEPTGGMDPNGREEMLGLITRIAASDKSVLVSSHILHDVEMVCKESITAVSSFRELSNHCSLRKLVRKPSMSRERRRRSSTSSMP